MLFYHSSEVFILGDKTNAVEYSDDWDIYKQTFLKHLKAPEFNLILLIKKI